MDRRYPKKSDKVAYSLSADFMEGYTNVDSCESDHVYKFDDEGVYIKKIDWSIRCDEANKPKRVSLHYRRPGMSGMRKVERLHFFVGRSSGESRVGTKSSSIMLFVFMIPR